MKLRIQGNSLRFRVTRPEVARLMDAGRIEETVYFAADGEHKLTYALEHDAKADSIALRYQAAGVTVILPAEQARVWAEGDSVGIYHAADVGDHGTLEVIVEKDFACLAGSEEENADAFPNPNAGSHC